MLQSLDKHEKLRTDLTKHGDNNKSSKRHGKKRQVDSDEDEGPLDVANEQELALL